MLGLLVGLSRDEHAARDALQETFVRAYGALDSLERGRALRPWLLRIARNVSLDARKRAHARHEAPTDPEGLGDLAGASRAPGPPDTAATAESHGLLRERVRELPQAELAVFLLKHDHELTYEDVAATVGCSVRTAKYRMRAALERLGREAERLGLGGPADRTEPDAGALISPARARDGRTT